MTVKCGKYRIDERVHIAGKIKKAMGGDVHFHFDGTIKNCRNGIYFIKTKFGDSYYASEDEIIPYFKGRR
jgi:hypothetical protein